MKKRIALTAALLLTTSVMLFAQEAPKPQAKPAEEPAAVHKTLWDQIRQGGWVMIPIGVLSMVTVYLIIDGALRVTSRRKMIPRDQVEAVKDLFRQGKYTDAYAFCKSQNSAFANVARTAISSLGEGKSATEEAVMAEMSKENSYIQTFVSYLSVIGVCAPMIGLLGTVTGMIRAFSYLGVSGVGSDPGGLAGAIGEVLVATASGLFIAIPAFMGYYWLRNRGAKALHDIQDTIAHLFRKMPYEKLSGAHVGDEELFAADPEWWVSSGENEGWAAPVQ
jgi:biopolymer transport protein ExbB